MNSVMSVLAACGLTALLGGPPNVAPPAPATPARRKTSRSLVTRTGRWGPISGTGIAASALTAFAMLYNFAFMTTPLCGFSGYFLNETEARQQVLNASVRVVESLHLPADSKVLFVGEAELFDARFPYAYSTVFDKNLLEEWTSAGKLDGQWTLRPADEILNTFHKEGITHVFVSWNEILRYRTTYGFTDFVTPGRLQALVDTGVLIPLPLPPDVAFRPWDSVDASWQHEIARRLPELKTEIQGIPAMLQFQAFQVRGASPAEENAPGVL
jgi:hypothetical protein